MSVIDERIKFLNFLINPDLNIANTSIKLSLDKLNNHINIFEFKKKFNGMVMGLSNYKYYMYDMLQYYSGSDTTDSIWNTNSYLVSEWKTETIDTDNIIYRNNLSDFILNLIINAVKSKFYDNPLDISNNLEYGFSLFYINININESNYNQYSNSKSNFLKEFISFFSNKGDRYGYGKNTYAKMLNASKRHFSEESYNNIFRNMLDLKIFDLYYYILDVEQVLDLNDNLQGIYFIKNFITMNILKYFYLSEMLLKVLLDTNENIDDAPNVNEITGNLYTPLSNIYNNSNIIKNEFEYDVTKYDTLKSIGMKLPNNLFIDSNCSTTKLQPYIDSVYKIIKDMYLINEFLNRNTVILKEDNVKYIANPNVSDNQQKNIIINLGNNIKGINKNITELNLKNLNIEKNYEKNRNIYYIVVIFIILYIFLNLYVIWSGKVDSLLSLNGILIILIISTKFINLIKKSYQTLVKDLNN